MGAGSLRLSCWALLPYKLAQLSCGALRPKFRGPGLMLLAEHFRKRR
jgi:hypothetical protein